MRGECLISVADRCGSVGLQSKACTSNTDGGQKGTAAEIGLRTENVGLAI